MAFIGVSVVFIAIVLLILSIPEEKKKKWAWNLAEHIDWIRVNSSIFFFFLALNLVCFIVPFLIECHTVQLKSQMKKWVVIIPNH